MAIQVTVIDKSGTKAEHIDAYVRVQSGDYNFRTGRVKLELGVFKNLAHRNAVDSSPLMTIPIIANVADLDIYNLDSQKADEGESVLTKVYEHVKTRAHSNADFTTGLDA